MTGLFTHSLLVDTDRDVRGAYRLFSGDTVRAPLQEQSINDRSSAKLGQPRKNFSVVAKEMAKTQGLAASFRNISNYLSLIDRMQ